jgi:hypothetical protein
MDLKELEREDVDWINLAQDRDQWCGPCKLGDEHPGSIKSWDLFSILTTVGFLRRTQLHGVS